MSDRVDGYIRTGEVAPVSTRGLIGTALVVGVVILVAFAVQVILAS